MATYFTSDTHFGHAKILVLGDGRPFKSIEEHDEEIIRRWNQVVQPKDEVYHLGDFCFAQNWSPWRDRLNGKIHIVWGNHDHTTQQKRNRDLFASHADLRRIKAQPVPNGEVVEITLCHYAMRVWNKSHHGTWHLFGHEHGFFERFPAVGNSFDVGVDVWNFTPISLTQVAEKMARIAGQRASGLAVHAAHHGEVDEAIKKAKGHGDVFLK